MRGPVEIRELKSLPGTGETAALLGKMQVLLAKAGAKDVTDFVRKLLERASDETFRDLTGLNRATADENQIKTKAQNISRMMRAQAKDNKLRVDYQEAVAAFIGFSLSGEEGCIWRDGMAVEFEQMLECKSALEADSASDEQLLAQPPSTANLDSQRAGKSWSLIDSLCSIILFGNQDGRADLDIELSGQPTPLTITDETGRRILLQRDVVVKHCVVELHLGGAEIHGGLSALKRLVASFLRRFDARHLMIDVGGSARAPRLIVQVREEAIGIARPLVGPPPPADTCAEHHACYLVEVQHGTKVTALVRIYATELQDQEPTNQALHTLDGDEDEPAVAQKRDRPLAVDDRVRIMMHLWKLAKSAERDPGKREPGVLTLSYDARMFVERKIGKQ